MIRTVPIGTKIVDSHVGQSTTDEITSLPENCVHVRPVVIAAIMAYQALQSVPAVPNIVLNTIAISGGNGNGIIESNECNLLNIVLLNGGGSTLSNLTATLTSTTPGVTIVQPVSTYPSPTLAALVTNITPFAISSSMPHPEALKVQDAAEESAERAQGVAAE